jgi:rhodanese-related sulfurtransferase
MRAKPGIIAQCLTILALSAVVGFGVNAVRRDGLPLAQAAKSSVQLSQSQGGEIGIKDAAMLFASRRAVFLDARSQFEYQLGHIEGALSLPPIEFASKYQDLKPLLAGKDAIITYCDGENCPLSHNLAKHLRDAGLKNVYVLKDGWSLWLAEKLPVSSGMGPSVAPATATKGAAPAKPAKPAKSAKSGKENQCVDCK